MIYFHWTDTVALPIHKHLGLRSSCFLWDHSEVYGANHHGGSLGTLLNRANVIYGNGGRRALILQKLRASSFPSLSSSGLWGLVWPRFWVILKPSIHADLTNSQMAWAGPISPVQIFSDLKSMFPGFLNSHVTCLLIVWKMVVLLSLFPNNYSACLLSIYLCHLCPSVI